MAERVAERFREIGQVFETALGAVRRVAPDLFRAVRRLAALGEPRDEMLSAEVADGGSDVAHWTERSRGTQDGTRSFARTSRSPRAQSAPLIARFPAGLTSSSRSHPAPAATCGDPSRISNAP